VTWGKTELRAVAYGKAAEGGTVKVFLKPEGVKLFRDGKRIR